MSEYIEFAVRVPKDDADSFIARFGKSNVKILGFLLGEEIVRCRDCKDYRASDATCHSWQWHNWDTAIEVEPDGFCAWGERVVGR